MAPIDSPELADFVANLDRINALADAAPGFVWRLQTDDRNATSVKAFDDDLMIVNQSVWETLGSLTDYAFRSDHRRIMVQRRRWFEKLDQAFVVLWSVPAGHIPDVEEAKARLELLRTHGPTADAFTFRTAEQFG